MFNTVYTEVIFGTAVWMTVAASLRSLCRLAALILADAWLCLWQDSCRELVRLSALARDL